MTPTVTALSIRDAKTTRAGCWFRSRLVVTSASCLLVLAEASARTVHTLHTLGPSSQVRGMASDTRNQQRCLSCHCALPGGRHEHRRQAVGGGH